MVVKTKDKLLQIRLEQDLYDRLAVICDKNGGTVSAAVRNFILKHVEAYERRVESGSQWEALQRSRSVAARLAESKQVPVVAPVVKPESALVKSRRLAKEAKAAKKAKGAEAPDDDGYDD